MTCPNGLTRRITRTRAVTFGVGWRACPLREQCTTSQSGRLLVLHPQDALLREHRRRAQDPTWAADYRQHRPMVERSIAWLTAGGNRRLRYRGVAKNNAWLHNRTAALNLRRLGNPRPDPQQRDLGPGLSARGRAHAPPQCPNRPNVNP